MRRALVIGAGLAGLTCARLLDRHGWDVEVRGPSPPPVPALVLSEPTCLLLRDVWQIDAGLFAGAQPLAGRAVRWGAESTVSTISDPAVAISGELLTRRLLAHLQRVTQVRVCIDHTEHAGVTWGLSMGSPSGRGCDWRVVATGRAAPPTEIVGEARCLTLGERHVVATEVRIASSADRRVCWIETASEGWVFLVPAGGDLGLVQVMVPRRPADPDATLARLLTQSVHVGSRLQAVAQPAMLFRASPQLLEPVCGEGWIAVGEAAVAFDPLSGDGAGCAVRFSQRPSWRVSPRVFHETMHSITTSSGSGGPLPPTSGPAVPTTRAGSARLLGRTSSGL